jgi:hypothetical protein
MGRICELNDQVGARIIAKCPVEGSDRRQRVLAREIGRYIE